MLTGINTFAVAERHVVQNKEHLLRIGSIMVVTGTRQLGLARSRFSENNRCRVCLEISMAKWVLYSLLGIYQPVAQLPSKEIAFYCVVSQFIYISN